MLILSKFLMDPYLLKAKFNIDFPFPVELLLVRIPFLECLFPITHELFPSQIVIATLLSSYLNLNTDHDVAIVGNIPSGFATFTVPKFNMMSELILESIEMMVVCSVCSLSLVKLFAKKHGQSTSVNQEFLAYGVSNTIGAFFQCYPCAASLSRTTIQEKAGGRTQMASLLSSSVMLVFILFFAKNLEFVPKGTLAAIIIISLYPSFLQLADFIRIWSISRYEALQWVFTFLMVVVMGVQYGIIFGLVFSICIMLLRNAV